MSLSAVNLAILRQRVIARLQGEWAKASDTFTPDQIDPFLSDAYREIQRTCMLWKKVHTVLLVAGPAVTRYARPTDMLDRLTTQEQAVWFHAADGQRSWPLHERLWSYLRAAYGPMTNPGQQLGPVDWGWDEADPESFLVLLPPAEAGATLTMDYVVDPGDLARVHDPDEAEATAAVTHASTSVTFSGSITGRVAAGDAFGVKAGDEALPTVWYRIASIDSATEATLSEPYAEATAAAAPFTCAEVSRLEYVRPGLIRHAPVEYALSKLVAIEEGEAAAEGLAAAWGAELARIESQSYSINHTRRAKDYAARHPALRRRL